MKTIVIRKSSKVPNVEGTSKKDTRILEKVRGYLKGNKSVDNPNK